MKDRGFLTIEHAFLIAIVVAGLIGMSVYLKRGVMGKWRESADTFGFGRQYEPGLTRITKLTPPPADAVDVASAYAMYEGHYNVYEENGGYFKVSYYKVTVDGKEMWLEVYESLNSSDPNDVKEVIGWVLLTNDENGVRSYASWWAGQENVTVSEVTWTDKQYVEVGYSYTSEHTDKYYKYNKENFDPHNFNWRDVIGELKGETKSKTYTERLPDSEGNYVFASTNYTYDGKGWVEGMTEVAYFNEKYGWIGSDHYDSEGRRFRSFRRVSGDKE